MIRITARQIMLMCAGHFMAFFDRADLRHHRYETEYETRLSDCPLRLWYRIDFSPQQQQAVAIDFELITEDNGREILDLKKNKYDVQHVLTLINDYLSIYNVITIKNYDNRPDCY